MRYSIASQALCGSITVSALAVPSAPLQERAQLVDISNFKPFPTADPKEFIDTANDTIRQLFSSGMFNDGPLDESGNFIGRPLAVLQTIGDKLELQFEEGLKDLEGALNAPLEGKSKSKDTNAVQDVPRQIKSSDANNPEDLFADLGDFFGIPNAKAGEPQKSSDSGSKETANTGKAVAGTGAAAATCNPSNPNVRFEWDSYSSSDRTAFVTAIKCLQGKPSGGSQYTGSTNRYEDLISVHRGMTNNIHQTATFLVWHRYFVWVFEQMLREECGFNRALPWWDETKHAGAFAASDVFTDQWFGHLPAKTSNGQGTCIESGEFSGTTLHVGPGTANTNHCLSRAVDESQTAQCNKDFTNSCLAQTSYDGFRNCFELGPHGYGHNGIGAVMAEVSASVGDPIFFMHHLFVDHTFRIWQNANPSRKSTINGCADKVNPCTPITVDTKLSSNGLRPDLTVGQVLNTLGGATCYRYNY